MCSVVRVVDAPATDSRTYIKHMCRATDRQGLATVCNLGCRGRNLCSLGAPQVARGSVHDGVGGEGHCEGGIALMSELVVIVNTGCIVMVNVGVE